MTPSDHIPNLELLSAIRAPLMTTAQAAAALGYQPGTLRHWATSGTGPMKPQRLPGSTVLRWKTNDVRVLAGLPPLPETPDAIADQHRAKAREAAAAALQQIDELAVALQQAAGASERLRTALKLSSL